MNKSAKRGRLSSALLTAAKGAAVVDADNPEAAPQDDAIRADEAPVNPSPAALPGDEIARRIAAELSAADNLLFNKGAASAAAFKPAYWSYEADNPPAPTETAPPEALMASEAVPLPSPATQPRKGDNLWLAGAACSCLLLVPPAVIVVLALSRPVDEGPAISPPSVASDAAAPTVGSQEAAPTVASQEAAPTVASNEPPQSQAPPPLVEADTANLVTRGDTFLGTGDIASARLYYEQAADAGSARAAMFLGLTFDPAFLDRAGTRGLHGDVSQAAMWYRRARDLGEPEAVRLLNGLDSK